jgi:uncharacterized membrane protein YphA (DoxX/SURF4 family)
MKVSTLTIVLLVALRLAIGWHLFYEGAWKQKKGDGWTSKGFLSAGTGPAAPAVRWLAGDPTASFQSVTQPPQPEAEPTHTLLERYTPKPIPPHEEKSRWHAYMPEAVEKEWDDYFDRFVKHYKLDQDGAEMDKARAENAFKQSKNEFVEWLREGRKPVTKTAGDGASVAVPMKTPDRVQEYLNKLKEIDDIREKEMPNFPVTAREKLDKATAQAQAMRKELLADLDKQTAKMKQDLRAVLTWEQKHMPPVKEPDPAPATEWSRLKLLDVTVRWTLLVVGLCLLLGLFTRPACVVGAGLLLLFYLVAPAPPLSPDDPLAREHYLFVNTNIIESVALLALATTRSGRWFGLDGLLQFAAPWRRRRDTAQEVDGPPPRARDVHAGREMVQPR